MPPHLPLLERNSVFLAIRFRLPLLRWVSGLEKLMRYASLYPLAVRLPPKRVTLTATLGLTALVGHVLYPAWLLLRTKPREVSSPSLPSVLPSVTVLISAYRESRIIEGKVADVLANGYVGALEVVVVADDRATVEAARRTKARVVGTAQRLGKSRAINIGVAAAQHEIVVISDANTTLEKGSIGRLAAWFSHPDVGAVAGEKRVKEPGGESIYWQFESWLKRRESANGTTIGLVGELAGIRKSLFRPLPPDVTNDDLWIALDIIERGYRVVYEPSAIAFEEPGSHLKADWERRTRVVAGMLHVIWRRRTLLFPRRFPAADQLWGHRLLRATAGPLAHVVLLIRSLAAFRRSRIARLFLTLHLWAAFALYRQSNLRRMGRLEKPAAQILFMQCVGVGGMARALRDRRLALWPKPDRLPRPEDALAPDAVPPG